MTTPNAAAALERLEQKWRETAERLRTEANDEPSGDVRYPMTSYAHATRLDLCADELATLRASLDPDAMEEMQREIDCEILANLETLLRHNEWGLTGRWDEIVAKLIEKLRNERASLAQQGEPVLWVSPEQLRGAAVAANAARPTTHWVMAWNCEMVSASATIPLFTNPAAVDEADDLRAIRALHLAVGLNPDEPNTDALLAKVCALTAALRPATSEGEGND